MNAPAYFNSCTTAFPPAAEGWEILRPSWRPLLFITPSRRRWTKAPSPTRPACSSLRCSWQSFGKGLLHLPMQYISRGQRRSLHSRSAWAVTSSAAPLFAASVILCDVQSYQILRIHRGKISYLYTAQDFQLPIQSHNMIPSARHNAKPPTWTGMAVNVIPGHSDTAWN